MSGPGTATEHRCDTTRAGFGNFGKTESAAAPRPERTAMIRGELLLLTTAIIAWWTFKGEGRRTIFFISLFPLSKRHPAAVVTPPSFSLPSTAVCNSNGRCWFCCCRWCRCFSTVGNDPNARRRHTLTTLAIMRTHKRTTNSRGRADNNEGNKNNCLSAVVILF